MNITVLDKGFVNCVSHMGSDLTVANAARVSFNKESTMSEDGSLSEKDAKLIRYLAKHNHWTPFAHPQITMRIKAPIFVRAQLGKHQVGLVMNEISRRYVTDEPQIYNPQWRNAPTDGAKQGASGFMPFDDNYNSCNIVYSFAATAAINAYHTLLYKGVAPEQARSILPQGLYTEWWWTGSVSAFARVYTQRIAAHAQWECQEYGRAIGEIIAPLFPCSWQALTSK